MDLRPFADFLLGTPLEPAVEFFISFRSLGLCYFKDPR